MNPSNGDKSEGIQRWSYEHDRHVRDSTGEWVCYEDVKHLLHSATEATDARNRLGHVMAAIWGLWQSSWQRPIGPSDFRPIMTFLKIDNGSVRVPEPEIAEWERERRRDALTPPEAGRGEGQS
jgi:hypothetical protein